MTRREKIAPLVNRNFRRRIFATGAAADINTGHSAASSLSNMPNPDRSFQTAESIGKGLSQSVCKTKMQPLGDYCSAAETYTSLEFRPTEEESKEQPKSKFKAKAKTIRPGII